MNNFFPNLEGRIYLENAGGTQVPINVINKVNTFLKKNYVQPYGYSKQSNTVTEMIEESKDFVSKLFNNIDNEIIFSTSATQIALNVSNSLQFKKDDNIILSNFSHESCVSSFERKCVNVKWWNINNNKTINYGDLLSMIDQNTKFISIPHVSNVLGNIIDIKFLIKEIRSINKDIQIYVDGVAYLAHGIIDVSDWDVDYYVVSFYKFFGLRISALYIKKDLLKKIKNQNHFFLDNEHKLEIGGIQYEQCVSLLGVKEYIMESTGSKVFSRNVIIKKYEMINNIENKLFQYFSNELAELSKTIDIDFLTIENTNRVPIFSIYSKSLDIDKICLFLNQNNIECKTGNFYCKRLLDYFNIDKVLRFSLAHYNTIYQLNIVINFLKEFQTNNDNFLTYQFDNITFSNNVKESFNCIKSDKYYNTLRYRAFSLIDIKENKLQGDPIFIQSSNYNNYLGDKIRYYPNIDKKLLNDSSFNKLISNFSQIINQGKKKFRYIYIHQIRIICNNITNPIPEGIHQDGFDYICIACVLKKNINSPFNEILDKNKNVIISKELENNDILYLNDRKFYHNVTTFTKKNKENDGHRDIFVLTTSN